MNFTLLVLGLSAVAFAIYALVTQWGSTTGDMKTRVLASMAAAAAAVGAAITHWLHSVTAP